MKIFLIGFMGSGKTHWAQRLAAEHHVDWIDLDQQVEKATGMTVKEIFATEGEAYFRLKEKETLQQLAVIENIIIATGGGTPCFHDNMEWMNENGITIWIAPDNHILMERLQRNMHKRPLISKLSPQELETFIEQKLTERFPHYSQAKHRLDGKHINMDNFSKIIAHAQ